jgi:conserved oligomeric Golgi complex subunit 3
VCRFIDEQTKSLQGACELILEEQGRLGEVADGVEERLRVFGILEPAIRLFSRGGDDVCLDPDFIVTLARLDDALQFVSQNVCTSLCPYIIC